jgi:hypothetical protein
VGFSAGGWYWIKHWTQSDRAARYSVDEISCTRHSSVHVIP